MVSCLQNANAYLHHLLSLSSLSVSTGNPISLMILYTNTRQLSSLGYRDQVKRCIGRRERSHPEGRRTNHKVRLDETSSFSFLYLCTRTVFHRGTSPPANFNHPLELPGSARPTFDPVTAIAPGLWTIPPFLTTPRIGRTPRHTLALLLPL
jgi:hypothetical protein